MTTYVNLRKAPDYIAREESFRGSNLYANKYAEKPFHWGGTGRLPEEWREDLRVTGARYVVFSYATPVGWITPEGECVIPDVSYSVSTARQVSSVRKGFNYSFRQVTLASLSESDT